MTLTKEQIIAAQDIKTEDVDVPEWGGTVRVCTFSATLRDKLMQKVEQVKTASGQEATLPYLKLQVCAFAIVDENGTRLFSDEEIEQLGKKSALAMDRVYAAAEKLNAVSRQSAEAAEKK